MATEEQDQKTIAFVLYPGLTLFDMMGPLQVLSALSEIAPEYRTVVVAERVEPMDNDIPGEMKVLPNNTFERCPTPSPSSFLVATCPRSGPWATRRSAPTCAPPPRRPRSSYRCAPAR